MEIIDTSNESRRANELGIRMVPGLLISAIAFGLYCYSILTINYSTKYEIYFGADPNRFVTHFTQNKITYQKNKRPLFGPVVGSGFFALKRFTSLTDKWVAAIIFSVFPALSVGIMYFLLQRFFCSPADAFIVSSCYALSFSNLVMFGIPESYGFAVLFIILLYALIFEVESRNMQAPGLVGCFGGVAGWTNPVAMYPLATYAFIILGKKFCKNTARVVAVTIVAAMAVFLVPWLIGYTDGPSDQAKYMEKIGASVYNLSELRSFANMFVGAFTFAVITPLDVVLPYYIAADVAGYFTNWVRMAAFVIWISILLVISSKLLTPSEHRATIIGLIGAMASVIIFYVYSSAQEFMLYTPLLLIPLFMLVGIGVRSSRWVRSLLVLFLVLQALINVAPLYKTSAIVSAGMWHKEIGGCRPETSEERKRVFYGKSEISWLCVAVRK